MGWVGLGRIFWIFCGLGLVGSSCINVYFKVVIILQHKKCIFTVFTRLKCCCLNSNVLCDLTNIRNHYFSWNRQGRKIHEIKYTRKIQVLQYVGWVGSWVMIVVILWVGLGQYQRRRQSTGTRAVLGAHGERVEREPLTGSGGRAPSGVQGQWLMCQTGH